MSKLPYKWFSGKGGWIHELLDKLPEQTRNTLRKWASSKPHDGYNQSLRKWALFKPDDINDLYPFPRNRISYPGVERIKGYRYPAPGSRGDVKIPQSESDDRLYDIKYFDRDTRRKPRKVFSWTPDFKRVELPPPPEPAKALGSPGNKNPAVLAYDPTGLRSAMSATNEEMEKALVANLPNHLVYYEWEKDESKLIADCKAKGIPTPPGKRPKMSYPSMARQARW